MRDVGEMQLSATVLSQEDLYLPISPLSDPYISPVSPAAVLPQEAKRLGLGRSLFERLQRSAHPVTIPHTQLPIPRLYLACISLYLPISPRRALGRDVLGQAYRRAAPRSQASAKPKPTPKPNSNPN